MNKFLLCVIGYFQEIKVFTPEAVFICCFVLEELGFLTSAKHFHFIDFKYIAFQLDASDYQGIALVINENLCSTRTIFGVDDTCFIPDEAYAITDACLRCFSSHYEDICFQSKFLLDMHLCQ